jgi:hypothetical protein
MQIGGTMIDFSDRSAITIAAPAARRVGRGRWKHASGRHALDFRQAGKATGSADDRPKLSQVSYSALLSDRIPG